MKPKVKYLALLVTLTFIVGQVQFAYSSYFCSMKQVILKHVQTGMTCDAMSGDDMADMGTGVALSLRGQQLAAQNCMQLRLAEKKVVDTFTGSDMPEQHFVGAAVIIQPLEPGIPTSGANPSFICRNPSPPQDLPTLLNNLRI